MTRWRFPATFTPRETAQDLKAVCEGLIDLALKNIKTSRKKLVLNETKEEEEAETLAAPAVDAEVGFDDFEDEDLDVGELDLDEGELDLDETDEDLEMEQQEEEEDQEEEGEAVVPHVPQEVGNDNPSGFVPEEPLQGSEIHTREVL